LSALQGVALSLLLLIASIALAGFVPRQFLGWLLIYLILTNAYSFWLKRKLLVDVILLAGLYTLRIIAGAVAVEVELTMWLLAFSMFFFLSLAFAKRYSELMQVEAAGEEHVRGRGYQVRDLRIIESVGPTSGYLAVAVFCNYVSDFQRHDSPVAGLYIHPRLLWMIAPVLLYWITRIWFIARRRDLHDDPIIFAVRDTRSHICGWLTIGIILLATVRWPWHF